ncbi:MAG TPA: HipA domain-containing protein [Myxococcus sp.]|nr:HipA domain-containing protein [Myxococcus sp.]
MSTLDVLLGSTRVGTLEQFEDEEYVFTFDSDWLLNPERPVLGQLFEDRKPGDIATSGLPCWFAHLLPQNVLRRAISRQFGIPEYEDFDLLRLLGEDLPGAVIVRAGSSPLPRRRAEGGPPPPLSTGPLRFSLAGAQWKLSVREGERGLTLPVEGQTGSWIAKFHDPNYKNLPRIEFATMRWAAESGIPIPPLRLGNVSEFELLPEGIPTGDGTVYLIQRFDRMVGGGRIHIEDMGQVIDKPPGTPQYSGRYEHIASVLAALAPEDVRDFCERIVFCVVCGNTDAHLKNWSLIYPDARHPRLSPAYDLVASVLFVPPLVDELALELGGSRRFESIRLESFRLFAEVTELSFEEVANWVRQAAERIRTVWQEKAGQLPYLPAERTRLEAHMARVPLLTD